MNSKCSSIISEQNRERQNQLSTFLNDSRESIGKSNSHIRRRASHFITQINKENFDDKIISKESKSKKKLSELSPINDEESIRFKNSKKNLEEFVDKALEIKNNVNL